MATFEAKVYRLKIEPHNNADSLELAVVGDYRSIVRKGQFKTGDLGVYIQEGSIVPAWLIEQLGLTGKLAGPQHNRVKAVKLRGIVSQGLIVPIRPDIDFDGAMFYTNGSDGFVELENGKEADVCIGEDLAELLGITKYEPPIPVHMAGEVYNTHGYTLNYDIENIKKFPDVLFDVTKDIDQMYLITEKLHGTWTCFGWHPEVPDTIVTSKGMSAKGLAFKWNEANKDNLYIRAYNSTIDSDGKSALDRLRASFVAGIPVYILGEVFGRGVQDLHYGLKEPSFRAFDIYVGTPGQGRYLAGAEFMHACKNAGIETVPVLIHGCIDREDITEFTDGKDNVSGAHIREGIVIRPLIEERQHPELGRVILKSVSAEYLLRKGDATEFN